MRVDEIGGPMRFSSSCFGFGDRVACDTACYGFVVPGLTRIAGFLSRRHRSMNLASMFFFVCRAPTVLRQGPRKLFTLIAIRDAYCMYPWKKMVYVEGARNWCHCCC